MRAVSLAFLRGCCIIPILAPSCGLHGLRRKERVGCVAFLQVDGRTDSRETGMISCPCPASTPIYDLRAKTSKLCTKVRLNEQSNPFREGERERRTLLENKPPNSRLAPQNRRPEAPTAMSPFRRSVDREGERMTHTTGYPAMGLDPLDSWDGWSAPWNASTPPPLIETENASGATALGSDVVYHWPSSRLASLLSASGLEEGLPVAQPSAGIGKGCHSMAEYLLCATAGQSRQGRAGLEGPKRPSSSC